MVKLAGENQLLIQFDIHPGHVESDTAASAQNDVSAIRNCQVSDETAANSATVNVCIRVATTAMSRTEPRRTNVAGATFAACDSTRKVAATGQN